MQSTAATITETAAAAAAAAATAAAATATTAAAYHSCTHHKQHLELTLDTLGLDSDCHSRTAPAAATAS